MTNTTSHTRHPVAYDISVWICAWSAVAFLVGVVLLPVVALGALPSWSLSDLATGDAVLLLVCLAAGFASVRLVDGRTTRPDEFCQADAVRGSCATRLVGRSCPNSTDHV